MLFVVVLLAAAPSTRAFSTLPPRRTTWRTPTRLAAISGQGSDGSLSRRDLSSLWLGSTLAIVAAGASPALADDASVDDTVPAEVNYDDFIDLVKSKRIKKVQFTDALGEKGVAETVDGARLEIGGAGFPRENPSLVNGPYVLLAKLRDNKVPYSFSFNLAKYNESSKKYKGYKNAQQLQADARGQDEAERIAKKRADEAGQ